MKLCDYLADWLSLRKPELKARTVDSYGDLITRLITPAAGTIEVDDLTPDDLRHILAGILEAGHERTAELVYVLLHAALAERHPAALVGVRRPKHRQRSPQPWTDDQMATYAEACKDHRHGLCFLLALMIGLRRGEICGLMWADVDFDRGEITIRRQRVRLASGELVIISPKSATSSRTIPIPTALLPRLRKERGHPDAFVCTVTPAGLSHAHAALVRRLQLPPIGLHGLRHSFATSSAAHVGDIRALQEILGHSSYAVTANIYVHPTREMLMRAVDNSCAAWYTCNTL